MNAKEMLDTAEKIIARQDVDRALLLFFLNTARKAVMRDHDIPRFYSYLVNVPVTSGIVELFLPVSSGIIDTVSLRLKSVKVVEHDKGASKTVLTKFENYAAARQYYPDFTQTGDAQYYLELGTKIYILPVPTTGIINILGEVWPDDLIDDISSSDITTTEIPEAFIYLAVAEYFDYFDEADRGSYWRQKGSVLLQQYVTEQQYNALTSDSVKGCF